MRHRAGRVLVRAGTVPMARLRPTGGVQMSPVLVSLDAEDRVIISSRQGAYKVRNLRRDPRVFVCLLPDSFFGN